MAPARTVTAGPSIETATMAAHDSRGQRARPVVRNFRSRSDVSLLNPNVPAGRGKEDADTAVNAARTVGTLVIRAAC